MARVRAFLPAVGMGLGVWLAACAPAPLPGVRSGQRVVVIGLDGADWDRIDPMIRQQRLPRIAALVARGASGRIALEPPPLSPLLWTTLATARRPDTHGILDFAEPDRAGGLVPVTGRGRRVKAIWNMLDDAGLTSVTVGWWATWPAEEVRGAMVADRWAYPLIDLAPALRARGCISPGRLAASVEPLRINSATLRERELRRFFPPDFPPAELGGGVVPGGIEGDDPVSQLRRVVASTLSFEAATLRLMRELSPALTLVCFEGIDEVGQRFARYEPPDLPGVTVGDQQRYGGVVDGFYRFQDEVIGRIVDAAGPEAAIVLVSDHGFARGAARPVDEPRGFGGRAALWHAGPGVLVLAGGPFVATRFGEAHLTDVGPTLLAVLGLPVAEDFEGGPLTTALNPGFLERHPIRTIASWERTGSPVRRMETGPPPAEDAEARAARLRALGYVAGELPSVDGEGMTAAALLNLATVLAEQGRVDDAAAAYRRAIPAAPSSVLARRGLFDLYMRAKRTDEALVAGRELLTATERPSEDSWAAVAGLWVESKRLDEAKRFLEEHPGDPSDAGPHLAQGLIAEAEGRGRDAEVYYRAALYRAPGSWDAAEAIFRLFEKQGRLDEAVPLLRQGLAARGGNSVPHLIALGYVALQRGDTTAAEDYLTRAAEDAPDEPEVLVYLGSVYLRTGRYEEAARAFSTVLAAEPGHLEVRANLIASLGRAGKVAQALELFRAAGPAGRDAPVLLNATAWACLLNGLPDEGLPLAERSLALAPDQPTIRVLVAEMRGKIAAARAAARKP
jgi:tetratricopeptide (TPR) repeat protein